MEITKTYKQCLDEYITEAIAETFHVDRSTAQEMAKVRARYSMALYMFIDKVVTKVLEQRTRRQYIMSKYPQTITPEIVESNKHITDEEIETDIRDTELEIVDLQKKAEAYKLLSTIAGSEGRMANWRKESATKGITERIEFVEFLKKLLAARQVDRQSSK